MQMMTEEALELAYLGPSRKTSAGHVEHSNKPNIWKAAEEARLVYTARLSPKKTIKLIKQKLNQEYKVKKKRESI